MTILHHRPWMGRALPGLSVLAVLVGLALTTILAPALAQDLDAGAPAGSPSTHVPALPEINCYEFGGSSESFSGSDRMRGNTYTVFEDQLLVEIRQYLDVNGTTMLYWYVLESPVPAGTYTVISETIVVESGAGQGWYSSGPVSVSLQAGMYYGIGVAWGSETVGYFRDPATLPRNWELGTVEDCMQHSEPPPYTMITYNHFTGAEYGMVLCFETATPVESPTWGAIKELFK